MPNIISNLLETLANNWKYSTDQNVIEGMNVYKNLGEQTNLLSQPQQEEIAKILEYKFGFQAPRESGMVNIDNFMVNQPGTPKLKPFPTTQEDYQRQLASQQAGMYSDIQKANIANTLSEIDKREYEANQNERAGKFGKSISSLMMGRDPSTITSKELIGTLSKDTDLDPLIKERVLKNYGLETKDILKNERWAKATKNIQSRVSQKDKGDLTTDMGFWANQVFPYVEPEQALSLIKHYTPSAGTIDKETLSDFELDLIKKYQAGKITSPEDILILSNMVLSKNPLLSMYVQTYITPDIMSLDPIKKKAAFEEFNKNMRNMLNISLGLGQPSSPTTVVPPPVPKIKANQVPQGGVPKEKPQADFIYEPGKGWVK